MTTAAGSLARRRISGAATPAAMTAQAVARMALDVRKADPSICTPMNLAGTRVAVTGAGGFIGSALCRRLEAEDASVLGLDIDASAADRVTAGGAEFRVCDTTDADAVADALPGCDLVVHTAAIVAEFGPMEDYVRVTVRGTRNVLDGARDRRCAARRARVLDRDLGLRLPGDLTEDAEPRPSGWPYQDTKAASDVMARRRGAVVVRPGRRVRTGLQAVVHPPAGGDEVRPPRAAAGPRRDGHAGLRRRPRRLPRPGGDVRRGRAGAGLRRLARTGRQRRGLHGVLRAHARKAGVPRLPGTVHRAAVWLEERLAQVARRPPAVTAAAMRYLNREHAYSVSRAREVSAGSRGSTSTRACAAPRPGSGRRGCCRLPLGDADPSAREGPAAGSGWVTLTPSARRIAPGYQKLLAPATRRRRGAPVPAALACRAMCGIAGCVVEPGARPDEGALERMAAALGHRGPDDRGVEVVGNVGLVHTRLSIVDPSPAGHQPMVDESGDWWLTYNGEVFNHLELRADLSGTAWRSGTDTETLLRALVAWGEDAVPAAMDCSRSRRSTRAGGACCSRATASASSRSTSRVTPARSGSPARCAHCWRPASPRRRARTCSPTASPTGGPTGARPRWRASTACSRGRSWRSASIRGGRRAPLVRPRGGRRPRARGGARDPAAGRTREGGGGRAPRLGATAADGRRAAGRDVLRRPRLEPDRRLRARRAAEPGGLQRRRRRPAGRGRELVGGPGGAASGHRAAHDADERRELARRTRAGCAPQRVPAHARELRADGADRRAGARPGRQGAAIRRGRRRAVRRLRRAARGGVPGLHAAGARPPAAGHRAAAPRRRAAAPPRPRPGRRRAPAPRTPHRLACHAPADRARRRTPTRPTWRREPPPPTPTTRAPRRARGRTARRPQTYLPHLLNRQDKNTMQHSIETRVPFLDPDVVALSLNLPLEARATPERKGVLRDLARAHLPRCREPYEARLRLRRPGYLGGAARPTSSPTAACATCSRCRRNEWRAAVAHLSSAHALRLWTGEVWCRVFLEGEDDAAVEAALWRGSEARANRTESRPSAAQPSARPAGPGRGCPRG